MSDHDTQEFARLMLALTQDDPLTWIFTGDSITHGVIYTDGARSYPEHLHEIVRGDLGRGRDVMLNTAISGHRLSDILNDWTWRVATWRPDVVILMIGTNDVEIGSRWAPLAPHEFAESLREFVRRVRALDAVPVLQTPPPIDTDRAPECARIDEFTTAMRDVAHSEGVILVDQQTAFLRLSGCGLPWALLADPFHPNARGHSAAAMELAGALGIRTESSRTLALLESEIDDVRSTR